MPENRDLEGKFTASGNPGGRPKVFKEFRDACREHTQEAIDKLAELMRGDDPKVACQASQALLDRGWGRPSQALTGPEGEPLLPAIDLSRLPLEQLQALDAIRKALTDGSR